MAEAQLYYPVTPIPPKPPQVTLLGSSISPPSNDVIENDENVVAASIALKNAQDQFENSQTTEDKNRVEVAYEGKLDAIAMAKASLAAQLGILPTELEEELAIQQDEKWVR